MTSLTKTRIVAISLAPVIVAVGLASRAQASPALLRAHAGDALYAILIYLLATAVAPQARPGVRGVWSLGICFVIEGLQAVDVAPSNMLSQFRALPGAQLVLGLGFSTPGAFFCPARTCQGRAAPIDGKGAAPRQI